jgi:hypothetical protein
MATIAGSAALLGWSIEQNEEGYLLPGQGALGLHWASAAAKTAATTTTTTQCDELIHHLPREGLFVSPTTNTNIRAGPRLRRAKTIDVLTQRANKKTTLESQYNVDWSHAMGEGAFGAVYSALHRETQEKVAVKKISKLLTSSATFEREMDALLLLAASGGHPNICSLREHFEQDGFFYLVLDLVEGGEMFDRLCEEGAYSEADAARLFRQVASALALMHGIGLVHRYVWGVVHGVLAT